MVEQRERTERESKAERKKQYELLRNQFILFYTLRYLYIAKKGMVNITNTNAGGYFEVPPEMASSLGKTLLLKPLVNEDMKPLLEIDTPFKDIYNLRKNASEKYYPVLRGIREPENVDTMDYSGRRVVRLNEVVINAKGSRFPKRNKVMGYLDSLALDLETAWTCGCSGGYGTTYLNDYKKGYTHHPDGFGNPVKIEKPKRGVNYELIKYSGGTKNHYVVDIQYMTYEGPQYSEEELLRMQGLSKADGYYPKHRFELPSQDDIILDDEDIRNTLLWLPQSQTDINGEFTMEFPTSEIKSTFKIQIIVITPNIYNITSQTEYFKIT